MSYKEKLISASHEYSFGTWLQKTSAAYQKHVSNNHDKPKKIIEHLIAELFSLGDAAGIDEKLACFEKAVLALDEIDIELNIGAELYQLIDTIGKAAGIKTEKYGDGSGLATEWGKFKSNA